MNTDGGTRRNAQAAEKGRALQGPRLVLQMRDNGYPDLLRTIQRPPKELRVVGDPSALAEGLSIIGARKATPYGRGCARHFAELAASLGVTVISGGALGCDSEAHRGALQAGGKTVVVLGGGCNQLYPARNKKLFQQIVDAGGAVISERDWDEPPLPWMFRERNRLIAGLSKATLVVEAGLPSGTFSTADDALAAGRDVLAVPGSITSPTSAGSNRLISQGASPIVDDETFESALSMLYGTLRHEPSPYGELPDDALLLALFANPMGIDAILSNGLSANPAELMLALGRYEQSGLISRYHDGRYGPSEKAIGA